MTFSNKNHKTTWQKVLEFVENSTFTRKEFESKFGSHCNTEAVYLAQLIKRNIVVRTSRGCYSCGDIPKDTVTLNTNKKG